MKVGIRLISLVILGTITMGCMDKNNSKIEVTKEAYQAWQLGEKTGDYSAFKKLLSPTFNLFSHPSAVRGVFRDDAAKEQMTKLIQGREQIPNQLTFSEPVFLTSDNTVAVQFNSQGTVMGKYPYKGYNIIVFTIEENTITGFREYFGDVEPAWFQN